MGHRAEKEQKGDRVRKPISWWAGEAQGTPLRRWHLMEPLAGLTFPEISSLLLTVQHAAPSLGEGNPWISGRGALSTSHAWPLVRQAL